MKKYWLWFIVPFIIIGFYLLYLDNFPIEIDFDKAGKFGDSFGVLNSLFSGLAFIALFLVPNVHIGNADKYSKLLFLF